ncbi:hypothetical protein ABH944_005537 [Caballeronia udeis]|uniref:Uncharacterized protein n=1 Tax=Caballeronia udeis TaxID=1232866 RepID=A0ABW8MP67_9BURK
MVVENLNLEKIDFRQIGEAESLSAMGEEVRFTIAESRRVLHAFALHLMSKGKDQSETGVPNLGEPEVLQGTPAPPIIPVPIFPSATDPAVVYIKSPPPRCILRACYVENGVLVCPYHCSLIP